MQEYIERKIGEREVKIERVRELVIERESERGERYYAYYFSSSSTSPLFIYHYPLSDISQK